MPNGSVDAETEKACRPQIVDDDFVRHLLRHAQREGDQESRPGRQLGNGVADRLNRVRLHLASTLRAVGAADARAEQSQVVVDLGRGAHRRSRGLGGFLLLDRYRWGEPFHRVDVWLLRSLEELL